MLRAMVHRAGLLILLLVVAVAAAQPARGQGIDETCVLALTKLDEGTTNVLYPDDSARYYSGAFAAVPGTEIRLAGRFPHARYMSYNVYDAALRPVDALADAELVPDAGSLNPFLPGADRTTERRAYTARIVATRAPERREPNTLYAGGGQGATPNATAVFTYRIYIPDRDRDEYGGVGLPTAEVVAAGTGGAVSPSVCAEVRKPETTQLNELLAQAPSSPGAEPPQSGTGRNPPHWRKFVNVASAVGGAFTDNATFDNAGQQQLDTFGGSGGFLSNTHNSYVSALVHRAFGQVLVTRFRAPTFPDTRGGTARMPSGELRYWSLCQNDPLTERVVGCLNDDRAVVGRDGFATFVVSAPNERPANATAACGVNWLPWGPSVRGALIYRNMLPSSSFGASIQRAKPDQEAKTMGDGFPVSRYYAGAAAFAKLGCAKADGPAAVSAPASHAASRQSSCASRRRFVVRLPRGARSARLDGRRLRIRPGRRVTVDLRGRRRTAVRLRIRLRGGRTLTRTYHPCARRT